MEETRSKMTLEERRAAASDPATSPDVLDSLALDEDCCVRACVASNPSTSFGRRIELMLDTSTTVRRLARNAMAMFGWRP